MAFLKIDREGMTTIDAVLCKRHYPEEISNHQANMMLHAIGADNKALRVYQGKKHYHAYRNYYDAGGVDRTEWDDLVAKGYAEKRTFFHVTVKGIRLLEYLTQCRIWDDYKNVEDCRKVVLEELMKDAAYCGYGCWLPTSSRDLSLRLAIPQKLVLDTLKKLAEEGLAMKGYYGEQDDEGYVHCKHGWFLTKFAQEKYAERYQEIEKAEYALIEKAETKKGLDEQ